MVSIRQAAIADADLLSEIGRITFLESHGHSASPEVIDEYVSKKFSRHVLETDLSDAKNIYQLIIHDEEPVGYSKIVMSSPHREISQPNVTKLDRLYLLERFHELHLGSRLFRHNLELSGNAGEAGMWLYTWKENHKAIKFYENKGFRIIGSFDFALSVSHTNPNYLMFLEY